MVGRAEKGFRCGRPLSPPSGRRWQLTRAGNEERQGQFGQCFKALAWLARNAKSVSDRWAGVASERFGLDGSGAEQTGLGAD